MGIMVLLQIEEPRAYQRVLAKLQRHGLVGSMIVFDPEKGASVDHQGAFTAQTVPTDSVLTKTRAFLDDGEPVVLTGRKRFRAPERFMLMAYYGARHLCEKHPETRRRGESTESRAQQLVADLFGYPIEYSKKVLKKAMGATSPEEKALFKRSPVLEEIFALQFRPRRVNKPR